MLSIKNSRDGFTLIELLVAIGIAMIVMSAIYQSYRSQQRSYILQEQIAAMQQNLRASLFYMTREIRMAGCDPTFQANAKIEEAKDDLIRFTRDVRGASYGSTFDGDTDDDGEHITYSLYTADGIQKLGRKSTSTATNQPVAEYMYALDFVYLDENSAPLDDDGNGNVTTNISKIKSIEITIVARTKRKDQGYTSSATTFKNQRDKSIYTTNPDDGYRYKMLTTTVRLRNL